MISLVTWGYRHLISLLMWLHCFQLCFSWVSDSVWPGMYCRRMRLGHFFVPIRKIGSTWITLRQSIIPSIRPSHLVSAMTWVTRCDWRTDWRTKCNSSTPNFPNWDQKAPPGLWLHSKMDCDKPENLEIKLPSPNAGKDGVEDSESKMN